MSKITRAFKNLLHSTLIAGSLFTREHY